MTRFHLAPGEIQGNRVSFGATAAHHLGRVLRAVVGDLVQAVDPHGELLSVRLTVIAPRRAEGLVVDRARLETEGSLGARIRSSRTRRDAVVAVLGPAEDADGAVQVTDVAAGFRGSMPRQRFVRTVRRAYDERARTVGWTC